MRAPIQGPEHRRRDHDDEGHGQGDGAITGARIEMTVQASITMTPRGDRRSLEELPKESTPIGPEGVRRAPVRVRRGVRQCRHRLSGPETRDSSPVS
jgi:hypothetical protein